MHRGLYPPSPNSSTRPLRSSSGVSSLRRSQPLGSNLATTSPPRRSASGRYRNSSDGVSAVLGGSQTALASPSSRPRTRGVSIPAPGVARPQSSGQLSSLLPPSPSSHAQATSLSLPYECKPLASTGKTSTKPIEISSGIGYLQGFRPTMEDNHFAIINGGRVDNHPVSMFGVLDGHCGKRVADLGCRFLPETFLSHPQLGKDTALAFVESIVSTDRQVFNTMGKTDGGSTCISAAVLNRMLFVACLGDARSVLYESAGPNGPAKTIAMSDDHKPQNRKETERIHSCGGTVMAGRVCGCLAVSRALGDFEFKFTGNRFIPNKELMVSNVADIKQINITDNTKFLILACDGLWDVLTNEDATAYVVDWLRKQPLPKGALAPAAPSTVHDGGIPSANGDLQKLLDKCSYSLCDHAIHCGSMDNVSVMIVAFHTDLLQELGCTATGAQQPSMNSRPQSGTLPSPGRGFGQYGGGSPFASAGRFGGSQLGLNSRR